MVVRSSQTSDLQIAISQEDALARLAHLESPRIPTFYECGIIETGVGYYQLAELPNYKRILLFGFNMVDLQLGEYPYYGTLFAHTEALYGVNVYDDDASPNDIYTDLVTHQAGLTHVMREQYTLVRTHPNVYQSPAVSYVLKIDYDAHKNHLKETKSDISIDAFIHSLHDKDYAPTFDKSANSLYDRMRVSRIPLPIKPQNPKDAIFHMLGHYTEQLNKLTQGKEGIQDEDKRLSRWSRVRLRMKIYGVRFIDSVLHSLKKTVDEVLGKKPEVFADLFTRARALIRLPILLHEGGLELLSSLWDAFNVSPFREAEKKTPPKLKPYVSESHLNTRLNPYLYKLDFLSTEKARPLDAAESSFAPTNIKIIPGNPFEVSNGTIPSIGAVRAPIGTVLHAYPNTTLTMQANGVWIATHHKTGKTYVGYNHKMDTNSKPLPSPMLKDWLKNEHIICYTQEANGHIATTMEWRLAAHAFQEILDYGDGHLIATGTPAHRSEPHVLPLHATQIVCHQDSSSVFKTPSNAALASQPHAPVINSRRKFRRLSRPKKKPPNYVCA